MLTKTALLASAAAAVLFAPTSASISPNNATLRALASEAGSCCQYVPNVDISGADLSSTTTGDKSKCCSLCLGKANCYASVWTNYNGGTCWHKSSYQGSATVKMGALAVISSCTPTYVSLNNCDMPGNDLKSVQKGSPNDCFAVCKATANCYGYTWSDYNGGTCWLKSALSTCVSAGNKFSGAMGQGGF